MGPSIYTLKEFDLELNFMRIETDIDCKEEIAF